MIRLNQVVKLFVVALVAMFAAACTRVPAGTVGVKFNKFGTDKGVQQEVVGPGYYWLGVNNEMYEFPTFTQTRTWTRQDGRGGDESITFQTDQGLSVNADVGITYHIDTTKVALLFQKYRRGIDEITDTYLHNMVRDALVELASKKSIETVYGEGKAELIESVQAYVAKQVADIGIVLEKVYFVGALRLPDTVTASINAKIQATQMAQQRQNEVAQAQAEAAKEVAKAEGDAKATLVRAQAEAQSIKLRADALRENRDIATLNAIEKWDGKLPVYNTQPIPFFQIPASR